MRRTLLSFLLLLPLTTFAQEMTLASDIWPPFTDVEGEQRICLDIVQEALKRNDQAVNFDIEDFAEVLTGIGNEDFDGSAALWKNEAREAKMIFSKPYLHNQMILVGKSGSHVDIEDFHELEGKKIGVVKNYAYDIEGTEGLDITFVHGENDQRNLEHLLSGKVDYILVDDLLIQYMLKYQTNDVSAYLEIGHKPLIIKSLHFALNKSYPNAEEIIAAFDQQITSMITDGSYHDILGLAWISADIDGDGVNELILAGDKAGIHPPDNYYGIDNPHVDSVGGFYINGKHYSSWDDVPEDTKVPMGQPDMSNYHEGGIIFKF